MLILPLFQLLGDDISFHRRFIHLFFFLSFLFLFLFLFFSLYPLFVVNVVLTWLFSFFFFWFCCCVGVVCEAGAWTAEARRCHRLPSRPCRGEDCRFLVFFFPLLLSLPCPPPTASLVCSSFRSSHPHIIFVTPFCVHENSHVSDVTSFYPRSQRGRRHSTRNFNFFNFYIYFIIIVIFFSPTYQLILAPLLRRFFGSFETKKEKKKKKPRWEN